VDIGGKKFLVIPPGFLIFLPGMVGFHPESRRNRWGSVKTSEKGQKDYKKVEDVERHGKVILCYRREHWLQPD